METLYPFVILLTSYLGIKQLHLGIYLMPPFYYISVTQSFWNFAPNTTIYNCHALYKNFKMIVPWHPQNNFDSLTDITLVIMNVNCSAKCISNNKQLRRLWEKFKFNFLGICISAEWLLLYKYAILPVQNIQLWLSYLHHILVKWHLYIEMVLCCISLN